MEVTAAIAGALLTAVVGGPIAYLLGYRRLRLERLYEQRALVIAELSRLLWHVQKGALLWTYPYQDAERSRERLEQARAPLNALMDYFGSNTIWLGARTSEKLQAFMNDVAIASSRYQADLEQRGVPGPAGVEAANRIKQLVPTVREDLEAEFRAILYPTPWYEPLLRALEWLEAKAKPSRD